MHQNKFLLFFFVSKDIKFYLLSYIQLNFKAVKNIKMHNLLKYWHFKDSVSFVKALTIEKISI